MEYFVSGFSVMAKCLLGIAGGAAALALALASIVLILLVLGAMFDLVTTAMAKRWHQKGRHPKSRPARILLESFQTKLKPPDAQV